jgi:hypothetical protein
VRESHPDGLMARGVPPEFVKMANDNLAAINAPTKKSSRNVDLVECDEYLMSQLEI